MEQNTGRSLLCDVRKRPNSIRIYIDSAVRPHIGTDTGTVPTCGRSTRVGTGRVATNEIQFFKAVGQVKYGCIFVLLVKGQAEPLGVSILLIKGRPNTVVFCSALLKTADNNIVAGRCMAR